MQSSLLTKFYVQNLSLFCDSKSRFAITFFSIWPIHIILMGIEKNPHPIKLGLAAMIQKQHSRAPCAGQI
jgi:hypothetical protein